VANDIKQIMLEARLSLTPSEERIVQILLADYPTSGLGTANNLARKAGVSDATVVRLAVKLGFDGFPDFQRRLLSEVEARLHSPLLMMETKRPAAESSGIAETYLHAVSETIDKTISSTPASTYERAARLIMDAKGRVAALGGRFSRHIAGMMGSYLSQFRPGIFELGALSSQTFDSIIDFSKRDVLIVFDYRRYQSDVIEFSRQAFEHGATIILFTDQWLSPVSAYAEVSIICPLEVPSPYDTMAPAVAQAEALVAHIIGSLDDTTRKRIERLESVRLKNAVTVDGAEHRANGKPKVSGPGPKQGKTRSK
jgi:DNA-binding MurR/RpiR family transcriptional regulator